MENIFVFSLKFFMFYNLHYSKSSFCRYKEIYVINSPFFYILQIFDGNSKFKQRRHFFVYCPYSLLYLALLETFKTWILSGAIRKSSILYSSWLTYCFHFSLFQLVIISFFASSFMKYIHLTRDLPRSLLPSGVLQ